MAKVDGGELVLRVLEKAGVRTIFTLHGGHLDAIYQAARGHGIRFVDTRHEQAAGHAADGWARTTGETGVALVTAGPGFTDVVTAIANAYLDAIPVVFLAGAAPLRDAERLPLQGGFDQVAVATPLTKWAHRITRTERIPDLLAQALRVARSGRPGPVFVEIPIDVLFARVEEEKATVPEKIFPDTAPAPSPEAVTQVVRWLAEAERPAILVGGGAWFSRCEKELLGFAETTRVPVFSNGKAHGMVPASHELCGGSFAHFSALGRAGVGEADFVLVLGARFGLFTASGRIFPPKARIVQVDIEGEEIGRNRTVDLGIVADCRETLRALEAEARGKTWPGRREWLEAVRTVREGHRFLFAEALERRDPPIHPYRLASEIASVLPEDAILVADGGETAFWMEMVARVRAGGHWLSHGYLGCLGTGMPFALAAKVAHPEKTVVCVTGDGSVGLNFAEFDTMVRHGLPVVTVVNNDRQWGMSAHGQDLIYGEGKRVVTELLPTRYDLAAAGFGCHAEHVERPEELRPALERALGSGKPACVNVLTDPKVIAPITIAMVGGMTAEGEKERKEKGEAQKGEGKKVRLPYYEDLEE